MEVEGKSLTEELKKAYEKRIESKELTKITRKEMKNVCRSKSEVYNILKFGLKIYLPKYKSCPFEFCRIC